MSTNKIKFDICCTSLKNEKRASYVNRSFKPAKFQHFCKLLLKCCSRSKVVCDCELVQMYSKYLLACLSRSFQIALALDHVTSMHYVHRNVRAQNVLLSRNMVCKLTGFSYAVQLNKDGVYFTTEGMGGILIFAFIPRTVS